MATTVSKDLLSGFVRILGFEPEDVRRVVLTPHDVLVDVYDLNAAGERFLDRHQKPSTTLHTLKVTADPVPTNQDEPLVLVHTNGPDTEHEAADAAEHVAERRALIVARHLRDHGPDYDERGARANGLNKDSFAPARHYLMRRGLVEDSGQRIRNERGRRCILWQLTPLGQMWLVNLEHKLKAAA